MTKRTTSRSVRAHLFGRLDHTRGIPAGANEEQVQSDRRQRSQQNAGLDQRVADKAKIAKWTDSLRSQLQQYGFGSFGVDQASLSPDTYRPEHEGFDLQTSISASDLIRTIWSYLHGLLELSRTTKTNHPGCIIFDEPRQQSTRDVSFAALLKRAAAAGQVDQQVIFFTSEDQERLKAHLKGLPHTFTSINGRVLKRV